jgi:hypothetical protein
LRTAASVSPDTIAAYRQAIDGGIDIIRPGLVTADGVLAA